ncbi:MAG: hypothetical protein NTW05_16140 [Pseudonocardiales bacterium]|nr:hypothetical protein [Pseudonocardiales bacterium]
MGGRAPPVNDVRAPPGRGRTGLRPRGHRPVSPRLRHRAAGAPVPDASTAQDGPPHRARRRAEHLRGDPHDVLAHVDADDVAAVGEPRGAVLRLVADGVEQPLGLLADL